MSSKRYPEEFKIEGVKQVTERGHPVAEVASRIGVSQHSLYEWLKTYLDREEARRDVFNYIEMFYNPKRRHGHANDVSPVEFENQYFNRLQSV